MKIKVSVSSQAGHNASLKDMKRLGELKEGQCITKEILGKIDALLETVDTVTGDTRKDKRIERLEEQLYFCETFIGNVFSAIRQTTKYKQLVEHIRTEYDNSGLEFEVKR